MSLYMEKKDAALRAVRALHADTTVPMESTQDALEEVAELAAELAATVADEINLRDQVM